MSGKVRDACALTAILLFAGLVRVVDLDWDQGQAFHPDERAIAFAVGRMSFRPLQLNPGFFAYGSLPLTLIRATSSAAGLVEPRWATDFRMLILIGRALSATAGIATILTLFFLGQKLFGRRVGLLAAFLLAACPLHIQQSHFMTTDVFLALSVLVTLYVLLGAVERGRGRDYVYVGACLGLSFATKISAAPLLVALLVAMLVRWRSTGEWKPILRGVTLALLVAAAGFALAEPYALLDFTTFWRQIAEQGQMVRHAGHLPYTIQYVGTSKYTYELTQMTLWGMGPVLAVAAIWATAVHAVRAVRRGAAGDLVLAAWVFPYFLLTGWFEVKFMRYLLPIYPVLVLWAARWLVARAQVGRLGRCLSWAVAIGTLLAAIAFLGVYRERHPVVLASEWVYAHIPSGSTLVTQHWDEGFPLPLAAGRPDRYRIVPLPYYDADTPDKIRALSRELAGAAFLALPTKRLYGAITRVPDRYPLTSNYFYLLFAGDLGYRLVYERGARPNLWRWEFPDELADESFSVYDHPLVLIFENAAHLSAEQIYDRILHDRPSRPMTRTDLLLARAPDPRRAFASASTPPIRSSWVALFWFAVVVESVGLAAYALLRSWLPDPGGYAAAKVLGLLALAYPPWLLTAMGQTYFSPTLLLAALSVLLVLGAIASRRSATPRLPDDMRVTELLFWGTFAFFLALRAWNPAIYWGEKPMDFAFLNTLMRTETLPPSEPWFSGSILHYTYFGHYLVAALGKLCHVHPALTFNLAIGLFGGLTATAAYGLGCVLGGSAMRGLLAAAFATLLGNLDGPLELLRRRAIDFDYFWATSRVIEHTVNEYPLWSFLFADLHAHVLAMPLSLTFLTLAVTWARLHWSPRTLTLRSLLLGLTLGAIVTTNGWSTPTYVVALMVILTCFGLATPASGAIDRARQLVRRVVVPGLTILGAAAGLYWPFFWRYRPPALGWNWETDARVHFGDYVLIFGLFLLVALPFLFTLWRHTAADSEGRIPDTARRARRLFAGAITLVFALTLPPVQRALASLLGGAMMQFWIRPQLGSVRIGLLLLAGLSFWLATRRHVEERRRAAAAVLSVAFLVTAWADVIHVWDRMNTIFKFYFDAWLFFAVASASVLPDVWRRSRDDGLWGAAWRASVVTLAAAAVCTAASGTYAALRSQRVSTPRLTLDGTAYLAVRAPDESAAIEWLNERVAGTSVLAEAVGPEYQEFARVSANTGLPTVLGWPYHVYQRGQTWERINERRQALQDLYTSPDRRVVANMIGRYGVSFIHVGELERRVYSGGNLANFSRWSDLLTPVFQRGEVTLFRVRGSVDALSPAPMDSAGPPGPQAMPLSDPAAPLRQPRGIAVDRRGNAYVADFGNHRIVKFDGDFKPTRAWGGPGALPGQFREPCAMAVDDAGQVYVADTWNHRIQVFDADGVYLRQWGGSLFGPRGIAIGHGGRVYVVDTGQHRILRFTRDGSHEVTWGGLGSAPGRLKDPMGIVVDRRGRVIVADNGNARVQVFDPDGQFLAAFPIEGWQTAAFSEPGVAVTADGLIWVTVPLRGVVRAYSPRGALKREIDRGSNEATPFVKPMGLAVSTVRDELLVSDLETGLARIPIDRP